MSVPRFHYQARSTRRAFRQELLEGAFEPAKHFVYRVLSSSLILLTTRIRRPPIQHQPSCPVLPYLYLPRLLPSSHFLVNALHHDLIINISPST